MILKIIGSGSKGNGYALIADNEILLLECGMPMKAVKKAINYNILKIKGCLVSHRHQDHLKYVREYLNMGITVYTNEETKEQVPDASVGRINAIPEFQVFKVGGFAVTPFYVPHNDTPCYAYLIQHEEMGMLLFATDFEYLPWTFKNHRVNHLLIECNYDMQFVNQDIPNYEHKLRGHASLETCRGVVEKNKTSNLKNVILCHLGDSTSDVEYFVNEIQKLAGRSVYVGVATQESVVDVKNIPF